MPLYFKEVSRRVIGNHTLPVSTHRKTEKKYDTREGMNSYGGILMGEKKDFPIPEGNPKFSSVDLSSGICYVSSNIFSDCWWGKEHHQK